MPPARRASTRKKTEISLEEQPIRKEKNAKAAKKQKEQDAKDGGKSTKDATDTAIKAGNTQITNDWQTEFAELLANASAELRASVMAMQTVLQDENATIEDYRQASSALVNERIDEARQHGMHNRGGGGSLTEAAAAAAHRGDRMIDKRAQDASIAVSIQMPNASEAQVSAATARARQDIIAQQQETEARKLEELRAQAQKQKADADAAVAELEKREADLQRREEEAARATKKADAACDLEAAQQRAQQTRGAKKAAKDAANRMDQAADNGEDLAEEDGSAKKRPKPELTSAEKEAKKEKDAKLKRRKTIVEESKYETWTEYCDCDTGRAAVLEKDHAKLEKEFSFKTNLLDMKKQEISGLKEKVRKLNAKIEGTIDSELEVKNKELENDLKLWKEKAECYKKEYRWCQEYAKERGMEKGMKDFQNRALQKEQKKRKLVAEAAAESSDE